METKTIYTCPMHTDVKSDKPSSCPKCGMRPVSADQSSPVSCCSEHSTVTEANTEGESRPKSFIGGFIYDLGKKDFERNKGKKKDYC